MSDPIIVDLTADSSSEGSLFIRESTPVTERPQLSLDFPPVKFLRPSAPQTHSIYTNIQPVMIKGTSIPSSSEVQNNNGLHAQDSTMVSSTPLGAISDAQQVNTSTGSTEPRSFDPSFLLHRVLGTPIRIHPAPLFLLTRLLGTLRQLERLLAV